MKKLMFALAVAGTLLSNGAFAQSSQSRSTQQRPSTTRTGNSAQSAMYASSDTFAWGIGLGILVIVGVIVGVTAAAASANANSK